MIDEKLSGALQENLLCLMVFDDQSCKQIRSTIESPKLFESAVFRTVAEHAIDFIDQFGEAPKEHISDSLEDILTGDDKRKATSFKRLLENLFTSRETINREYALSCLHKFVRQQKLKAGVVRAVEAIEDGRIDDAEVELQKSLASQVISFEAGTLFNDAKSSLAFLEQEDQAIRTGIKELDDRGIGLRPQEQLALIAPSGVGKTWGLIHLGKLALIQRKTVVHISLEMSEKRVAQRYMQSFLSVSNRHSRVRVPMMQKDKDGNMSDVLFEEIERRSLQDPNIKQYLTQRLGREFKRRPPLIIKQFPTGMLTVPMLDAYLDGLERHEKIVPDVVLIDYPALMAVDSQNMRTSLGDTVKQLRGQAVRRNYAQGVADQSNREGAKARLVEATHSAEDWSKIATADTVITISQTAAEKKLGLARAFTAKVRNEEGGHVTLLTQAYGIGQFALDSAPLGSSDYWSFINGVKPEDDDDDK